MPALSSTMSEGKIVSWLKQPGDRLTQGESVLVVESDKAEMDVECFHGGILAAVLMPAGSTSSVGETLALIAETEAEVEEAQRRAPAAAPADTAATPTTTGPGDLAATPAAAPPASNASTSNPGAAASAIPAPPTGTTPADAPSPAAAAAPEATTSTPSPPPADRGRVIASPRAKVLAKQLGVALDSLRGSGPHGRIVANDVERAAQQPVSAPLVQEGTAADLVAPAPPAPAPVPAPPAAAGQPKPTVPGLATALPGQVKPFTTLQEAVNRNMMASLAAPCFRVGYTITTEALGQFYRKVKPKGVTMTALLAKAVGVTLARHPQLNCAFSDGAMRFGSAVNVAVAVAMDDGGLVTPVLTDADRTDLYSLSRQWADLVKRSRSKQLKPEEYSSGTFSLSNLGTYGVDRFDAILPPGTGAILTVGASRAVVVVNGDGSLAVKPQMQVNLTADHRVIYGAHAAAFLQDLANTIETRPESLAL